MLGPSMAMTQSIRGQSEPRVLGLQPASPSDRVKKLSLRAMGVRMQVILPAEAQTSLHTIVEVMRAVESRMSIFLPESELSRLNATSSREAFRVSPSMGRVLRACTLFHRITGGAFDPTVGPLTDVWGCHGGPTRPASRAVEEARRHVGLHKVRLEGDRVRFTEPGVAIDLGGIAIGFAVDQAIRALQHDRVAWGLVNVGGHVRVLGSRPGGSPWVVGIHDPLVGDRVLATVELQDGRALSTSSMLGSRAEVSHIFDPRTGDAPDELLGVTVLAPTAMEADALSTACAVLGAAEARRLLERAGRIEGLLVLCTPDGVAVEATDGACATVLGRAVG
jgi:thiamine biosynthesis lipoprotein